MSGIIDRPKQFVGKVVGIRNLLAREDLKEPLTGDEPESRAGVAAPRILHGFALALAGARFDFADGEAQAELEGAGHTIELIGEHQFDGVFLQQPATFELPAAGTRRAAVPTRPR